MYIFVESKKQCMSELLKVSLFIQIVIFSVNVNAQKYESEQFRADLSVKISLVDEKKIEKGVELLNAAYNSELEAIDLIENLPEDEKLKASDIEYKKAVKKMVQTSELYREGSAIIYNVFQENCVEFQAEMQKMKHYASGLNKAKLYERKSGKAYERASSIRELLLIIEKPELLQYKLEEAMELEKLAIQHRGRALQIFQDFPVEYDYNWENDITPEEVEAAFKDPAIVRPPKDLFVQAKVVKKNTKKEEYIPISFRVQIAAHTVRMEDSYIQDNIYFGQLPIKEIHEGGWYKYSIGEYENFNEANALLKSSRVAKSFVVAYQGASKLSIKEALEIIKENQ